MAPVALRELLVDTLVQPSILRESIMCDGLLDLLLVDYETGSIGSFADAKLFTSSRLWRWMEKTDALIVAGIENKIALNLFLHISGTAVAESDKLSALLKKVKISREKEAPIMTLAHVAGRAVLTVRIPDVPQDKEGDLQNVGHLLNFAMSLLALKSDQLQIVRDKELGVACPLPAQQQRLLDHIKVSAEDPSGEYLGQVFEFKSGFKANLVEIQAALRILNSKSEMVRVRPSRKGEAPISATTREELKAKYNLQAGLNVSSQAFGLRFIKNVLAVLVRPSNKQFPSGWISAAKKRNEVKAAEGLLHCLGYTYKVCPDIKVESVLKTDTTTDPKGVEKLHPKGENFKFGYAEFRTAVALTLPKITPNSDLAYDKQVKQDVLGIKSVQTLKAFTSPKRANLVDATNMAFAIYQSCSNPKSKAKAEHFKNARNHVLNASNLVDLVDATGTSYNKFSDIPEKVQKYLAKRYGYTLSSKRSREESPEPMDEDPQNPSGNEDPLEPTPPAAKVRRTSGGRKAVAKPKAAAPAAGPSRGSGSS
jgi:hypothetical protein